MANVVVPPFYVPRPSEEQLWSKLPVNAPIIPFLTEQKMFGAGGQVPAKRWNAITTFDDASVWNIPPKSSAILPLSTFQKFYGVGGQSPTKRWNVSYVFDDASVWNTPPFSSAIIPLSMFQKFYGVGGQAPTKRWNVTYTFDDPPAWLGDPNIYSSAIIQLSTEQKVFDAGGQVQAKQWRYDYSEPPDQKVLNNRNNAGLLSTAASPFAPVFWKFNSDEPLDQKILNNRNNAGLLAAVVSPFAPVFWKFNSDDAVSWSCAPVDSAPIQILTSGGKPNNKQWHYDNDDHSVWSFSAQHDLPLSTIILSPFTIRQWPFGYDNASVWNAQPIDAAPIAMLTVGGIVSPKERRWDNYDAASAWSLTYQHNAPLNIVSSPAQTILMAPFYVPRQDEITAWQWVAPNPIAVSMVAYNFSSIDIQYSEYSPVWQWSAPNPIAVSLSSYNFSGIDIPYSGDFADWDGGLSPQPSNLLLFPTLPPPTRITGVIQAPFYVPRPSQDQLWSVKIEISLPLSMGIVPYQTGNQYFNYIDNPSSWNAKSIGAPQIMSLNGIPYQYGNQYFSYFVHPSIWSGTPIGSKTVRIPPTGKPFVPKFYKFDINYSEFWKQPTKINFSIATAPGIPPFNIRQPSFNYDDLAFWYASSVPSTVLPTSTVGGIIKAKQWHYDIDDFSSWYYPWNSFNQVNATAPKVKPFNSVYWNFNNDDQAPSWQRPVQRYIAFPTVPNINAVYWKFNNDDPPPWKQPPQRSSLFPSTLNINAVYWQFNNDDAAAWYVQTPQRNAAFPLAPQINNRWQPNKSEDQLWALTVQTQQPLLLTYQTVKRPFVNYWRLNLLEDQVWMISGTAQVNGILPVIPTVQTPPVIGFNQTFIYDDPAVWSGGLVNSDIIPDLSVAGQQPRQWIFGYDDPTVWSGSPLNSNVIPYVTIGGQVQSHQWLLGYDIAAIWSGKPISSNTISGLAAGGQSPTILRNYTYDDFSTWSPWVNRNLVEISLKPTISVFWKFNNDDTSVSWQPPVQSSLSSNSFKYPNTIRQPSFAHDDHSSYQWKVRNPIILSLTWNIDFERIANTTAEKRIVDASIEDRTIVMTPEMRIANTAEEKD